MSTESALIIFAKPPIPGRVKTRLTTLLSPADAAKLYEAFLKDALDLYTSLGVSCRLYLGLNDDEPAELPFFPTENTFRQIGHGLGERMSNAFKDTFEAGFKNIAIIGTDHPTLPTEIIQQGLNHLKSTANQIVIGPSEDGGYYLLGMNKFYPTLFSGLDYSHDQVFNEAVNRAESTPAGLKILATWYDVDEPELLPRLIQDLEKSPLPAENTRKMIQELKDKYPQLS